MSIIALLLLSVLFCAILVYLGLDIYKRRRKDTPQPNVLYAIVGASDGNVAALASLMNQLGYQVVDTDQVEGLGDWIGRNDHIVHPPKAATAHWYENHHFHWNNRKFNHLAASLPKAGAPVFICGNVNKFEQAPARFRKMFYLESSDLSKTNRQKMMDHGAIRVDANQSLEQIATEIEQQL